MAPHKENLYWADNGYSFNPLNNLWSGPNKKPALPESIKWPSWKWLIRWPTGQLINLFHKTIHGDIFLGLLKRHDWFVLYVLNTIQGRLSTQLLDILTYLKDLLKYGKWILSSCPSWLEHIPKSISIKEIINNYTLGDVLCTPSGYTFVCDYRGEPWAYECLDSWRMAGQCLLGYHSIPFQVLKKKPK